MSFSKTVVVETLNTLVVPGTRPHSVFLLSFGELTAIVAIVAGFVGAGAFRMSAKVHHDVLFRLSVS